MSIPRSLPLLVALVALMPAVPARAIPFYFEGPGGIGLDPGDTDVTDLVSAVLLPSDCCLSAGDPLQGPSLEVTTSLVGVPTIPGTVGFATPIEALVEYTVTNTTGSVLDDAYLLFTLGAVDGDPDPWPMIEPPEFGLEQATGPGAATLLVVDLAPYVFAAVLLPHLGPNDVQVFRLTHLMADELGGTEVPSPGLALHGGAGAPSVPEPAVALLLALALAQGMLRR